MIESAKVRSKDFSPNKMARAAYYELNEYGFASWWLAGLAMQPIFDSPWTEATGVSTYP